MNLSFAKVSVWQTISARFRAVRLLYGDLKIPCKCSDNRHMGNPGLSRQSFADDPARSPYGNGPAKGPSKESERWLLSVVQNTSDVVSVVDATLR
jgi:hypothetical protein